MGWKDMLGVIPGVDIVSDAAQGDWKGALLNAGTGGLYGPVTQGASAIKTGVQDAYGSIKNAVNAPYAEKKAGYDAVIAQADAIKQQRIDRNNALLAQADAAQAPARAALNAVYGDPSKWKI